MARFAFEQSCNNGKQTQLSGYIRGGTVGGFEIDARERSFPRTDHRVKSWFGRRHEGVIRAVEQLNSIATATELLARGTCKRSRCYGPRNPFARACENPSVTRCFPTRCRTRARRPIWSAICLLRDFRLDIADRIFIHLFSFCILFVSVCNFSTTVKFHRSGSNRETFPSIGNNLNCLMQKFAWNWTNSKLITLSCICKYSVRNIFFRFIHIFWHQNIIISGWMFRYFPNLIKCS